MSFGNYSSKLVNCQERGDGTELFVVEGDSAARSVARVRNESYQAVLPMQGKPLNAWKASQQRVARFDLFNVFSQSIGTGLGDAFKLSDVKFGRVVLLFDPDADGIHCGALLSMFLYRWMNELVTANRVLISHAPLYEFQSARLANRAYAYTDEDHDRVVDFMREKEISNYKTICFRGLGNLPPEVLREKCVDPTTRRTSQLTESDCLAAINVFGGQVTT
ncbi:MAG: toprim domain-containing protein [Pirellulaceae bacterium]